MTRKLLPLFVIALSLQACTTSQMVATKPEPAKSSVVIEPEELARSLASSQAPSRAGSKLESRPILLDARKLEDYGPAHAAGAQRVDMSDWTRASREGDGPKQGLRNVDAWSVRIGALGIDEDSTVIVYDEGGMTSAARAWFILRECGVRDVRVVNGGWAQLCPALDPRLVQAGNPGEFVPTRFAAREPSDVVTREELKRISLDRTRAIIDVRTADEYQAGEDKGRRSGHVPGAASVPHKQMIAESGRLRSPEEIRALFAGGGTEPDRPAVVYCQSGGRAAFAALAAEHAGLHDVSVYYMSMGEWSADPSCPME